VTQFTHLDLDVLFAQSKVGYKAQVVRSPAGEGQSVEFAQPFNALELENFVLRFGMFRTRTTRGIDAAPVTAAKEFGGRLFDNVFADAVGECLRRSRDRAQEQHAALRIRLMLSGCPELADLPWELLYDRSDDWFLALSGLTPVVRFVQLPEPPRAVQVTLPLRILVIKSEPEDYPRLDLDAEWAQVAAALRELTDAGKLEVTELSPPTLQGLRRALVDGAFHVLHYMGHGGFDSEHGGTLLFAKPGGGSKPVSGWDLGMMLHDHNSMSLAVLNSCEGARTDPKDPFAGVADTLVRRGVPAVVAMQFEVSDAAAIEFAPALYGALAAGLPVDGAVAEARKAMYPVSYVEWATPVLYLRAENAQLFDITTPIRLEARGKMELEAGEQPSRRIREKSAGPGAQPRQVHKYQRDSAPGRLAPAERAARGRTAQVAVPLDSHVVFDPPPDRPDAISLLEKQAGSLMPELAPIRQGRMMVSPYAFFRGTALTMAIDLATTPVSGLAVQACGDAQLSNFGIYSSAERQPVSDINNFEQTLPGPWEWDVKRLAASLEVAGRDNGFRGKDRREIVMAAVASYRRAMRNLAGMTNLDLWYAQTDTAQWVPPLKRETTDSMQDLLTQVDGRPRIISTPPMLTPIDELMPSGTERIAFLAQVKDLIAKYRRTVEPDGRFLLEQFEFADVARKIVGVGSVGLLCWLILMLGRDDSDPLLLEVKQVNASVLSHSAGVSKYASQGQRVVEGQRLMQGSRDIFLGWQRTEAGPDGPSRDLYIRRLPNRQYSALLEAMTSRSLREYGELCGWTLARAHARSGDRIAISAYLGSSDIFDRAITKFAKAYADQNERDYTTFVEAVRSGRVIAEHGI